MIRRMICWWFGHRATPDPDVRRHVAPCSRCHKEVFPQKWDWRDRLVRLICDCFTLGDHEYIRGELRWRYPFVFFLTVLEPRYRTRWRRWFFVRVRFAVASLLGEWHFSRCTRCHNRFTLRELVERPGKLDRYQSGSICHQGCHYEPRPDLLAQVEAEFK